MNTGTEQGHKPINSELNNHLKLISHLRSPLNAILFDTQHYYYVILFELDTKYSGQLFLRVQPRLQAWEYMLSGRWKIKNLL